MKTTRSTARVPDPIRALSRQSPLPWQTPKSVEDDTQAPQRIAAIRASPNYLRADEDPAFLASDEMRGVRLQMEFAKAETLLEQHHVKHTIVVFGSTRICEPAAAGRAVRSAKAALLEDPENDALLAQLKIAERIFAKAAYYEVARAFGRLVSDENRKAHHDHTFVITGGGPGIMEAANRGSFEAAAKTIGLNISLPHEQYPNPYVSPELCFTFRYFALRKLHFLLRAKALVTFPGGYGTLDELFEVLALIQTRKIKPMPVILVGEEYWRKLINFDFLVEEGTIDREDRDLFWFAETAEDIWGDIQHWHKTYGTSANGAESPLPDA